MLKMGQETDDPDYLIMMMIVMINNNNNNGGSFLSQYVGECAALLSHRLSLLTRLLF